MAEQDLSLFAIMEVSLRRKSTLEFMLPSEREEVRYELEEYMDNHRSWVVIHGCDLKKTEELFLDYRLRESPNTHELVRGHLNDFSRAIEGSVAVLSQSDYQSLYQDPTWATAMNEYVYRIQDTVSSPYRMSSIFGELKK